MNPQLIVIDQIQDLKDLIEYLKDKDYISYDCETTGLTQRDRVIGFSVCAEEDKAFYVILEKWEKDSLTPMPYLVEARELLLSLQGKSLIMHNGVFDCMMAESYFKVSLIESLHTDTMIAAHLINENRRVGLKELAKTMFGEDSSKEQEEMKASVIANGGKLTTKQYEMYKADAFIMGKYGAKDAWLTYKLFLEFVPQLEEQGLFKFFYEDESMPLLRGPTYQLNTTGLKVDQQALLTLKKTLEAECLEAKTFIYNEILVHIADKDPGSKQQFNINASKQLSWLLFGKLGLEFSTLTDKGKEVCKEFNMRLPYTLTAKRAFIAECERRAGENLAPESIINGKKVKAPKIKQPWDYIACDKKTLTKLAPRYKWIERLLEYQRKTKILTTYVKGIEERTQYGIIRPSFLQHGTTSGRYSSRNPNFQNLPRDDKRVKSCIISRPGKVFVGADYSQLEPRVFAYYSGDKRLLDSFANGEDFYSVIGMDVYDKYDCVPLKEGPSNAFGILYPKLRVDSKTFGLAVTYGATAYQLAPTMKKSIEDAQQDIDKYFERFPGVRQMMLESHQQAKTQGYVSNLFGRPRRMPEAKKINKIYGNKDHADLPYEIRNMLNLAVNHRIQSTGASIVNRAAIMFDNNSKQAGIYCNIVVQVHDSLVIECNESDAEAVSILLQDAMESAVDLKTVKLEAIPKVGRNLSEV